MHKVRIGFLTALGGVTHRQARVLGAAPARLRLGVNLCPEHG